MASVILLTESYHPHLLQTLSSWSDITIHHIDSPNRREFLSLLPEADIWIMRGVPKVTSELLRHTTRLKYIIRAGSGIEHIDKRALEERGILLFSTPQANAAAVAEYVVAALILLCHKMLPAHHMLREHNEWKRHSFIGKELSSLTVGIIGFGNNGSRTAYLLKQLGARVLAYDKYKAGFSGHGILEVGLETLWKEADAISLHVPLTEETEGCINEQFLARFHKPIALINAARGKIVSLSALAKAFKEGRIWGAALDTLPQEPPERLPPQEQEAWDFLRLHPSVLITPHIAGSSEESEFRLAQGVIVILQTLLSRPS
ncbi:MAG: NAD(P)-dependent oxidoreductase [Bacteroidia bacterium]|nr:hypothetical protein [Bacteroidia bacterium]MDW8134245.1 NAD(P)-dependent oxidoreductase [Bacteroidia bacterium]